MTSTHMNATFLLLLLSGPPAELPVQAVVPAPPVTAASRDAATARPDVPFGDWTQLRYRTSKLLVFTGDLTMSRTLSEKTLSVRTESSARLFGSRLFDSWSVSTMDRKSGRPLQFLNVRPGRRAERWGFDHSGILHETLRPHKKRPNEPFESWRVAKSEVLPDDPADESPSRWVHDYISMIVRLRDLPLEKVGDETTVRVSTAKGPAPMRVSVSEERSTRRALTDLATGKTRTVELRELRLRVAAVDGSPSDAKGFLDMQGETELWVEATTRSLTEVSGNVPKVPGRVVITLSGYRSGPA